MKNFKMNISKRKLSGKAVLFASALTLLLPTACTKDFTELNTNPISYTGETFDPNFVLTTAQLAYTGSNDFAYDAWRANLIYASTMMQGFATVMSYWAGDKYQLNAGYTSAYWERAYDEQVKRVVDLVEFTRDKPQYHNLYQLSRIWKAMVFQRITDLYGDVPYSEAGLGYYQNIFYPKYDTQQSIYLDILKEVDEATAALDASQDAITGDMVYAGDIAKWKRFGSTLLLRMAMRLTKVDETTARSYAERAIGHTLANNSDNAFILHDESGGRVTQNRTAQVFLDGGQEHYYVKWSNTFIDFLKSTNDPRLAVAVTNLYPATASGGLPSSASPNANYVTAAASQKGMPNGKDLSGISGRDISSDPNYTQVSDYSAPHPVMISRVAPTFLLTYSESELLLAEAAVRWGIGGTAAAHYAAGVKASITYLSQWGAALTITEAVADTYVAAHPLLQANAIEQISEQYWLHNCTTFNFYEVWSNWRRTGYPTLAPVNYVNNATQGTIPRRFPYPTAEESTNPTAYRAASAAVPGGDLLTGRVWWDAQ
ncbi:SusD/RagB family nutrient-binding outer membrane lipoprotein [Sphingobacterium oryzagri]|uniref:SusD/RagB family nutrient-binding outer membrane lipoprotein n=1 Tax=Sphingobacterium oryzagri TaxID=3025669 RepID=A0ABY7WM24_9SPHI|nr:SusD/RagB family nutrient-binding outer membrane lipoprotein [Sphingobacterium sp. KACC 22765]WDF68384.1 SusD/RagB family nutrient-binding outer membrane lipoprotein [Sphingobacterium sp. KACC 22765]